MVGSSFLQHFKNIIPLPPGSHGFSWEICHSNLCSFLSKTLFFSETMRYSIRTGWVCGFSFLLGSADNYPDKSGTLTFNASFQMNGVGSSVYSFALLHIHVKWGNELQCFVPLSRIWALSIPTTKPGWLGWEEVVGWFTLVWCSKVGVKLQLPVCHHWQYLGREIAVLPAFWSRDGRSAFHLVPLKLQSRGFSIESGYSRMGIAKQVFCC